MAFWIALNNILMLMKRSSFWLKGTYSDFIIEATMLKKAFHLVLFKENIGPTRWCNLFMSASSDAERLYGT
jgi:hypothetical protein